MNLYGCGKTATLVLENGVEFEGKLIGYPGSSAGEVVFNTGMVGYPETFSDPSYKGQIQCITYPLVGNYGVPKKNDHPQTPSFESDRIHLHGVIISDYSIEYSHSTAIQSLSSWLHENNVPGLYDIDTRRLTKILREEGSMLGKIVVENQDIEYLDPNNFNLVDLVSPKQVERYGDFEKTVMLIDCGCKSSIVGHLLNCGVNIIRVPYNYNFDEIEYDAVLFSNGPGNPETYKGLIDSAKKIIKSGKPALGICLGHQIISLAAGARAYKLRYGHRGQNQPVIDKLNHKCYITSQNHGYAIDDKSLPGEWINWFENLNDHTNEGIKHDSLPVMTVQFHPEANPGPVDTTFIFDEFIKKIGG